jgi:hypothetical protein
MYQHICCHSHNWYIPTMQFSYFPLNMQVLKMYSMFLLHFWIYVNLCLQTCIPFIFFLERLFFHFYFIHEYFTCILTWILFSFSNNCSISQFSQKNATQRVEGKKKLYDLTNFINLEKSKCKNLQKKVLTFLSSPHCGKMQIFFYNAYEMEMFFFFKLHQKKV